MLEGLASTIEQESGMTARIARIAGSLALVALLAAGVACAPNADAQAKAQYDRAATYLQAYSSKTDAVSKALLAYKQKAQGGPTATKAALPTLDETDKVLAERGKDLALAKAALGEASKLNISDKSRKLGTGLLEIVVIAERIDAQIAKVVVTLREGGAYYSSGGKDKAKLKAYSDAFNAAAVELAKLYSDFDKKRAEVGALVGK
jgi:hypothetical protein